MIIIEKSKEGVKLKLEVLKAGEDLCILVTGGDKPHIGAVSLTSRNNETKTIVIENHKEYVINEFFTEELKLFFSGNVAICSGIHIDNITKKEIEIVKKLCNELLIELKMILTEE
jgi:hypothetical protein